MIPDMPWVTIGLACLASMGMLLVSVTFLVDWIRLWKRVKAYWEYGVLAGLVALGFSLFSALALLGSVILDSPEAWLPAMLVLFVSLAIGVVGATRIAGFTMLGMHYAAELGHPSFPLLQRWFGDQPAPATDSVPPAAAGAPPAIVVRYAPGFEGVVLPESMPPAPAMPASLALPSGDSPVPPGSPPVRTPGIRGMALAVPAAVVTSVVYSTVLFRLTSPRTSEILRSIPGFAEDAAGPVTLGAVLIVLQAALSEEIAFRLGLQGFLARYLRWQGGWYWLAIVLSSALWTLGHAGAMDPDWVKFAQIFPTGLMLGWLYRKCGVGSCIAAHGLFNLAMILLPSSLTG